MIFDRIERIGNYMGIHPNINKAILWLENHDIQQFNPGKYNIDGDNVYMMLRDPVVTKEPVYWETHDLYADIQIILDGAEVICYSPPVIDEKPSVPYCLSEDFTLYSDLQGYAFRLQPGTFMLILPTEPHKPGCPDQVIKTSKKAVVKVKLC